MTGFLQSRDRWSRNLTATNGRGFMGGTLPGLTNRCESRLTHARMSKILIAVSSPWASERVVEPLADMAKRLGAEILAVHVSRPSGGQMREQEQADGENAINLLREK